MFGMKLMSSNFRFLRFGSSHRSRNGKQEEWGSVSSLDGEFQRKWPLSSSLWLGESQFGSASCQSTVDENQAGK